MSNLCSYCGHDHGEVEIEYCECGEHCDVCSEPCIACDVCGCWGECDEGEGE